MKESINWRTVKMIYKIKQLEERIMLLEKNKFSEFMIYK